MNIPTIKKVLNDAVEKKQSDCFVTESDHFIRISPHFDRIGRLSIDNLTVDQTIAILTFLNQNIKKPEEHIVT